MVGKHIMNCHYTNNNNPSRWCLTHLSDRLPIIRKCHRWNWRHLCHWISVVYDNNSGITTLCLFDKVILALTSITNVNGMSFAKPNDHLYKLNVIRAENPFVKQRNNFWGFRVLELFARSNVSLFVCMLWRNVGICLWVCLNEWFMFYYIRTIRKWVSNKTFYVSSDCLPVST